MSRSAKFKFNKHLNVGAAAAEDDSEFLSKCFVDTGDFNILRDPTDVRCIVVGRTGTGKTALLTRLLEVEANAVEIRPSSLSLTYIANNNVIQYLTKVGVRMDLFYKLLWLHVFTVELIRSRFRIGSPAESRTFLQQWFARLTGKKPEVQAFQYLLSWGEQFWEETEYRIREVTTKLETQVQAELKGTVGAIGFTMQDADKLTEEQKKEVVQRAQQVVNKVQIKDLHTALDVLSDLLDNEQQRFFLVVDDLDQNWAEDEIRYRLIRALVETAREFRHRIRNVKIVVAIRLDLLERVFQVTRDSGFQEEKFDSLYLRLAWTREQLTDLVDLRIRTLTNAEPLSRPLTHKDILPRHVRKKDPMDYILERTFYRPRDVILFFNACIRQAVSQSTITASEILGAEAEYSTARMTSVFDEWYADYPSLACFSAVLKNARPSFRLNSIIDEVIANLCLNAVTDPNLQNTDSLLAGARRVVESDGSRAEIVKFKRDLFHVLYRVGFVGLKIESHTPFAWSFGSAGALTKSNVADDTTVEVHPAFKRALGIREAS